MTARLILLLELPLLVIDCFFNFMFGGSFGTTLSAEAWAQRTSKYWGWSHRFIDALFSPFMRDHCAKAAYREYEFGSVWAGWWNDLISKGTDRG